MRFVVTGLFLLTAVVHAGASAPVIFQTLDPVKPDETLLLFGADVSASASAEGLRLRDQSVSGPPLNVVTEPSGAPGKLKMLQASDLSAKVLIPADWKPGVFAVRLANSDGTSDWQFVNRPQLWWQVSGAGGRANPGGELRVFGKNLGAKSRLWLVSAKGQSREISVKLARDYDVTAELPGDLAPGSYRAWLHNGFGGQAGFGDSLPLEVVTAAPWPATVFDVTRYGAVHDGQHDDTEAIRQALKGAEINGGGVVYLPSGTYIVTGKLVVPTRTVIRGEKRESVWIKVPAYWPAAPQKLAELDSVMAGTGDFGVENLSIMAQPVQRVITAPDIPALYGLGMARLPTSTPSADRVHLRNLRIEHTYFGHRINNGDPRRSVAVGPSTIVVNGADFTLEDSKIISAGMPIQIHAATRARIVHNILRTGRNGWYGLWNFSAGVFEDNDIFSADLEGSGGGIQGSASEIMFRGNHWHDAYGDEREALTFDTPYYPAWMGHATVSGCVLTFQPKEEHWLPEPNYPKDLMAVIAAGRGLGQAVPVVSVAENGVTLQQPFKIAPDATSIIVVSARKSHAIITDNVAEDASVAFQLYSQSHEFIIANNRASRTGGSYAVAGEYRDSGRHCYSYALFNQWLGNVFEEGMVYDQGPWPYGFVGYVIYQSPEFQETTSAIGNRFTDNQLLAGTQMGAVNNKDVRKTGALPKTPRARDAVFEKNLIASRTTGITLAQGQYRTLLRGNHFLNIVTPTQDNAEETVIEGRAN